MPPDGPAGSFFHRVPDSSDDDNNDNNDSDNENNGLVQPENSSSQLPSASTDANNNDGEADKDDDNTAVPEFDDAVSELLRQRRKPPRASRPSTINGIPTEKATGFGKPTLTSKQAASKTTNKRGTDRPYVAIGPDATATPIQNPPVNDPSKPEMDDQGYTLYTNEETGEKSRVFDALVDYPCKFTLKIVGANEGTFVEDMLMIVADACHVLPGDIEHSTKAMGKWTSVTVQAPVESSVMLYSLYEKVDLDPRVKFKF